MTTTTAACASHGRLEHLPVSLFSIVMGLAGTTIAVEKAEHLWAWSGLYSSILLTLTILVFSLISLAYLAKFVLHRQHVVAEFNHPIRLSFFPSMSIGVLLLAIALMGHYPGVSLYLWALGSAVQLVFTLAILSNWMHHEKYQVQHSNPAWFITLLLFFQAKHFVKLTFALPWWAYSFPLAAMTIASGVMLEKVGGTALAMLRGQICVPE